jgi:acyl-CoA thioesterase-1
MYLLKIKSFALVIASIMLGLLAFCQNVNGQKTSIVESKKIIVLGDSLSAEYGITRNTGWVSFIQQKIISGKYPFEMTNVSISGETTIGGKQRISSLLEKYQPQIIILELGANDALRGLSLDATKSNLEFILMSAQKTGAKVLILGMKIPPNYGKDYSEKFAKLFPELGFKYKTPVVPFFLEKIATNSEMFQNDRIHPNEKAQPILANTVWPSLQKLLQ